MSSGMPVRCFTCGKIIENLYISYLKKCESGMEKTAALDELKLGRPCCRRMFLTHVDVLKYQLAYPTYEDGVQRLGTNVSDFTRTDREDSSPRKPKAKAKARVIVKNPEAIDGEDGE